MKLYEFGPATEKIFVVGDVHGAFESFLNCMAVRMKEPEAYIAFLGDHADRGNEGVEILESFRESSFQSQQELFLSTFPPKNEDGSYHQARQKDFHLPSIHSDNGLAAPCASPL